MKRNTKDELRYPVHLDDYSWYYVEKSFINVYHEVDGQAVLVVIPRKKLERLLKIK